MQFCGAGRGTGKVYRAGLVLGGVLGVVLCGLMFALLPVLHWLGQPPEVNRAVVGFLILTAISVIPVMLFTAAKSKIHFPEPDLATTVAEFLVNDKLGIEFSKVNRCTTKSTYRARRAPSSGRC